MIIYGAAPMSPDRLLEGMKIFGDVFLQFYGQTEVPQCITTLGKSITIQRVPGGSAPAGARIRWLK